MPLLKTSAPLTSSASASAPAKRQVPPFTNCTRTSFISDKSDWLHITSPQYFTNFDICPDCYEISLKPTNYAHFISPAPPRPEGVSTRCDFSDLWVRIAWSWLYMQNAPDLSLLGQVAEVQDPQGSCPNLDRENEDVKNGEKPSATRTWYCLLDTKTGGMVEDMTVCSDCVSHIYTIMPCLRGIFAPAAGGQQALATCDLMLPASESAMYSERTLTYLDRFIEVAEKTLETGQRDVTSLTDFVKKWASVPVCKPFKRVTGERCYSFSTQVPEWTVCEECYLTHVHPLYSNSPQPMILSQISQSPSPPPSGFQCQLYSPRLQQYFQDAVSTNDLQGLRQKVLARNHKLEEVKRELEKLKMAYAQQKTQANYHWQMMQMQQQSAMVTSLAWQVGGSWGGPVRLSHCYCSREDEDTDEFYRLILALRTRR